MYKERELVLAKLSLLIQVILAVLCFAVVVSYFPSTASSGFLHTDQEQKNAILIIALLYYIVLDLFKMGYINRMTGSMSIFKGYLKSVTTVVAFLIAFNVVLEYRTLRPLELLSMAALNLIVLTVYNNFVYLIMRYLRRKGYNSRQILIIADKECEANIEEFVLTKDWGFRIWGIMTDSEELRKKYSPNYTVMPIRSNIKPLIDTNPIDDVIYCRCGVNQSEIKSFFDACAEIGVGFHYQTKFTGVWKEWSKRSSLSKLAQLTLVSYQNAPDNYIQLKLKSLFDFIFSLFIIVLTFPIQVAVALAIKLDDGGPVFFKQERVGLNGRRFYCLKFRTMVVNAEALKAQLAGLNEQEGPVFKIKSDPRITKVGHFLRKTSLDEFPQFINVIRGDMSVVGPRPPLPSEVEKYERWQIRRLSMKPGITCTWQVSGRNNIPFTQWMKLDLEYIDNWSFKNDLLLIIKTVKVIFLGDGV